MNEKNQKQVANNDTQKKELYPPGTELRNGDFRIICRLGEGGMASVYKALDVINNKEVAIKINNPNFKTEKELENFKKTFRTEVDNIAILNQNENVIKLLDWEVEGNPWLIILEYADGGTLYDVLKTHPIFSLKEMQFYFGQLTNALAAAHEIGITHRDIKPENVFLDSIGNVKLGDFGISFTKTEEQFQAHRIVGTPKFMPPEISFKTKATFKSDIYSLGVLMYICATGCAPFTTSKTGKDAQAILFRKHMNTAPIRPSDVNVEIPSKLSNLILKMLEKSPMDRPESVLEIRKEILSDKILEPEKPYIYKGRKKYEFSINEEYKNDLNLNKDMGGRAQLFKDQTPRYLNKKLLIMYMSIMIGLIAIFASMIIFVVLK